MRGRRKGAEIDFLKEEIARGFIRLAALNLKGRPAAADLAAVAEVWVGLLRQRNTVWDEERDRARIQAAFTQIALNSSDWPNPRDLIHHLPPLPEQRKLVHKHPPTASGKAALARIQQIIDQALHDAPLVQTDWIHGHRSRTADECKRIYAARQHNKGQHDEPTD